MADTTEPGVMDDFFAAIEAGDIAAVRAHLERDRSAANVVDSRPTRSQKPRTNTALHVALWHNHPEIARLLLDFGADVNASKSRALRLSMSHTRRLNLDLIRMLVERGADVNRVTDYGGPPLTSAFRWWSDEHAAVEFLLSHGADVNAPARNGETPLDRALIFLWGPAVDHVRMVGTLLRYGANVNPARVGEEVPWPPMCRVAWSGNLPLARMFIEAGADVNASTRWGTPLHYAAEKGNDHLVELLLAAGADPSARDANGRTPLDLTPPYEELLTQVERWQEPQ